MLLLGLLVMGQFLCCEARTRRDTLVMDRVFGYKNTVVHERHDTLKSYNYVKYSLQVRRRNAILLTIPTLYAIAHGPDRSYLGETYSRMTFLNRDTNTVRRLLDITTMPHRKRAMPNMVKYLMPNLYDETLFEYWILSPFHRSNRIFYRYRVIETADSTVLVAFRPRTDNTQLVRGMARVDAATGRIVSADISGEYDMIRFQLRLVMSERDGYESLFPTRCDLKSRFKFFGNNLRASISAFYDLPQAVADSLNAVEDTILMDRVRPVPLTVSEQQTLDKYFARKAHKDSLSAQGVRQERDKRMARLWERIGERILSRTRYRFGEQDNGYLRFSPILNPLYFGYSKRRGLYYKFDIRGEYAFSDRQEINLRLKAGYSFKQHMFYFRLPLTYVFDRRHMGFARVEVGNGNRISNSSVVDQVKHERADSIDWDKMNLDYFKDTYLKVLSHYDFTPKVGLELGFVFHRRSAVDKTGFHLADKPTVYRSAAPMLELELRPGGYSGHIITIDYERSFKGLFRSNTEYEKWEVDAQHIHRLSHMQALSMRLGGGLYTHRSKGSYFLDYTNFRENNIPGGWNDDWTGEFELLDRRWYNASEYYVRGNLTYESPLLVLAWAPLVGHFIEKERLYVSALMVNHLHPYVECGYGFTTRAFSMGVFVATRNGDYDGIGCRFGFELFRNW